MKPPTGGAFSAPPFTAVASGTIADLKTNPTIHYLPDATFLETLGRVAVRHGQLEYALRMVIKTVTGVDVRRSIAETKAIRSTAALRREIREKARAALGAKDARALESLIDRTTALTNLRNDFLHGLYAQELDGPPMLSADDVWRPLPKLDELIELASKIASITSEIHEARLHGFLAKAERRPRPSLIVRLVDCCAGLIRRRTRFLRGSSRR